MQFRGNFIQILFEELFCLFWTLPVVRNLPPAKEVHMMFLISRSLQFLKVY